MSTKEKYLIGVDRLDAQHRALFSAISRLKTILLEEDFERNKRICKELVRFLEDHVTRHFSDEEAYMREIHYAHYERHKEQHEAIVQMVASMKEEMEASDYSPQSIKHLVGTLLPTLIYHTESVDRFIGKEDPQCDTANDAAQAMSKTMISVVNELFGQSVDLSLETPDFGALPERFVLKCTHDSGGLAICRDLSTFDMAAARRKIERSLANNYFWSGREWPYKDVRPRIIAEEYLDPAGEQVGLTDYKVMCFGGQARCEFTCTGRADGNLHVDFFDTEWNHMPFTRHYPNADVPPEAPERLKDMVAMAERLSEGMPFVRVDFYEVAGQYYFGEMTFYPGSGMEEFDPERWDEELGSWIELPELD